LLAFGAAAVGRNQSGRAQGGHRRGAFRLDAGLTIVMVDLVMHAMRALCRQIVVRDAGRVMGGIPRRDLGLGG